MKVDGGRIKIDPLMLIVDFDMVRTRFISLTKVDSQGKNRL